jgi:hypothetical protein
MSTPMNKKNYMTALGGSGISYLSDDKGLFIDNNLR